MARHNSIFNISIEEDDEVDTDTTESEKKEDTPESPVETASEGEDAAEDTKEDLDKTEEATEEVEESLDVADELSDQAEDQEAIIEQKPEEVTEETVAVAQEEFSYQLGRLNHSGFKSREEIQNIKRKYSMEAASTPLEKFKVSTEAIKDFIFNLIQRVMQVINSIINFFRRIWRKILVQFANYESQLKSLMNKYSEINNQKNGIFRSSGFATMPANKIDPEDLRNIVMKYGPYLLVGQQENKYILPIATGVIGIEIFKTLQKSFKEAVMAGGRNINNAIKTANTRNTVSDTNKAFTKNMKTTVTVYPTDGFLKRGVKALLNFGPVKWTRSKFVSDNSIVDESYLTQSYNSRDYKEMELIPITVESEGTLTVLLMAVLKRGSDVVEDREKTFENITSMIDIDLKILKVPLMYQYLESAVVPIIDGNSLNYGVVKLYLQCADKVTKNIKQLDKSVTAYLNDFLTILKDMQKQYIEYNSALTGSEKYRVDGEFRAIIRIFNSLCNKLANTIIRGNIYFCKNTVFTFSKLYGGNATEIADRRDRGGPYDADVANRI